MNDLDSKRIYQDENLGNDFLLRYGKMYDVVLLKWLECINFSRDKLFGKLMKINF